MIDRTLLDVPSEGPIHKLPFGDRVVDAACFVYCYHIPHLGAEFEVAAWWKDQQGICHALVYATGSLFQEPVLPDELQALIDEMIASQRVSIKEAVTQVMDAHKEQLRERWTEFLRNATPLIDIHTSVPESKLGYVFKEAERVGLAKSRRAGDCHDCFNGNTRIILRTPEGKTVDLSTYRVIGGDDEAFFAYHRYIRRISGLRSLEG